jgi:cyclophilin family peptidyl-prolyl cis-trans isomerase
VPGRVSCPAVPSEKRTRQRAGRDARRQAEAKSARQRSLIRNAVIVVILAAVVIGSVVLITNHSSGSGSTTTTTTAVPLTTQQEQANQKAVAAGCPKSTKTRANTLSWPSPPAMSIDTSKTYKATVKTTVGTFVITLMAKTAPTTVNNFVFLADQGFYKCVIFHRVIPGFMDQTGDPTGTGTGGPGYKFDNENIPKAYATGDVAMANSGANTNGSQFFVLVPGGAQTLDADLSSGGYSLFGKVSKGMTVVEKINADGDTTNNGTPPKVTQRMLSVTISTS